MPEGLSRRLQRALGVALGVYFSFAGIGDLLGVVFVVPGLTPAGAAPGVGLVVGCAVMASAAGMFLQKTSTLSAGFLGALWVARTIWDMTGGQAVTREWTLLFPLLALVAALGRSSSPTDDTATERSNKHTGV